MTGTGICRRHGRLAVLLLALFCAASLTAGPRRVLSGHTPRGVAGLPAVDRLSASAQMDLILGLPLRNKEGLTNLLRELYDPASARFHQFLTAAEFAEQFGPTTNDYEALKDFARSNHLQIQGIHGNRTLLNVRGSVADIERTFQVSLRVYRHPHEKRNFFAPDSEPTTDSAAPLISITGLDNFSLPHPSDVHPVNAQTLTSNGGSGAGGSYLGADFRAAYVPGTPLTGAGQSVAMFEVDGYYAADIARYTALAGLPSATVTNILVDGFSGAAGPNNLEVALDIEMALAMAPGLSQVLVYEGPNQDNITGPNDILNRIATDNLAKQIGCSWNFSINTNTEQIFLQFIAQGQSFFLAVGDNGAFGGTVPTPSDDPNITVVGGTTLTTGTNGAWTSERVWNWFTDGTGTNTGGGGVSTVYALPSWQQGLATGCNQASTVFRNTPDVAMAADGIGICYNNGTVATVGGTSASAPLWAGLAALINQQAAANGRAPVGFLNPAIYSLGNSPASAQAFHDITAGNNTNKTAGKRFFAQTGYDLCTGWGTPAGTNLINLLAPPTNLPVITGSLRLAAESSLPANGVIDPYETVTLNLTLTNLGGMATSNLIATPLTNAGVVLAGGALNFGAIPAGGGATLPLTFSASGVAGGNITVAVRLNDGVRNLGVLSQIYTLGLRSAFTNLAENFDGVTAPTLPPAWTSGNVGVTNWTTSALSSDTGANSAHVPDSGCAGASFLFSPVFRVTSAMAQLSFRQNFDFESDSSGFYDGGALEISIGGGPFADFLAAGGSFSAGGYNAVISGNATGNVLTGRAVWGGHSGGYWGTVANLPPGAAGQNVQLRWVCGTDLNNSGTYGGWYVDTVSARDYSYTSSVPSANLVVSQSTTPSALVAGQTATFNLFVSNSGPCLAAGVIVTDALPAGITIVSCPTNCVITNGAAIWNIGTLALGAQKTLAIAFCPNASGQLMNSVTVGAFTPGTNGPVAMSSLVSQGVAPSITAQPTNVTVALNGTAVFQVSASGTAPILYQWYWNGTPVAGAVTNPLTLANVQAAQAGWYSVVVTNGFGVSTSAVASLGVRGAPVSFAKSASGLRLRNGVMTMTLTGLAGQGAVAIESSTDMVHWTPVYTNASCFGQFTFSDTNSPANPGIGSCFYRAHVLGGQ